VIIPALAGKRVAIKSTFEEQHRSFEASPRLRPEPARKRHVRVISRQRGLQIGSISIQNETSATGGRTVCYADTRGGTGGGSVGVVTIVNRLVVGVTNVVTPHHQPSADSSQRKVEKLRTFFATDHEGAREAHGSTSGFVVRDDGRALLDLREVENMTLLQLGQFDPSSNLSIFARANFIVREETSYERVEKRTHSVVGFRSVRRRFGRARHGGARAKQRRLAVDVEGSQVAVLVVTVVVTVIAVAEHNVVKRKDRRNLVRDIRRLRARTRQTKLSSVVGQLVAAQTLTVHGINDTSGDVRRRRLTTR